MQSVNRLTILFTRGTVFNIILISGILFLITLILLQELYNKKIVSLETDHIRVKINNVVKVKENRRDDPVIDGSKTDNIVKNSESSEVINQYVNYILSKIEQNKVYPEKERTLLHEGVVGMKLIICRSGKVEKLVITKKPGFAGLLDSAVNAVKKSLPFKPFPSILNDDELQVNFKIRYSLY